MHQLACLFFDVELQDIHDRLFTKRGYDSITEEINFLWNEERPMVLQEVHDAALQGDRSENAAYIYGKQRMRMIDKRLRILRQKIKDVKVVDTDALLLVPSFLSERW